MNIARRRIVQVLAGFTPGDAISEEAIALDRFFRSSRNRDLFQESLLVAEHIAPGLPVSVISADAYLPEPGDVILIHYSIATLINDRLIRTDLDVFLLYHNVTPSHFFRPYDLTIAGRLARSRLQLKSVAGKVRGYFADSNFNARELRELGCEPVHVLPVLNEILHRTIEADARKSRDTPAPHPDSDPALLFVGRLVPNKGHRDLIKIMYYLKSILPGARLTLAGGFFPGLESYVKELRRLIRYLKLEREVRITGYLEQSALEEEYRRADLFLCASHHEGFCVPLLEAMAWGAPVLSYYCDTSAAEETMAGAGLGFRTMEHKRVAELAALVLTRPELRAELLESQEKRLEQYRPLDFLSRLGDYFRETLK